MILLNSSTSEEKTTTIPITKSWTNPLYRIGHLIYVHFVIKTYVKMWNICAKSWVTTFKSPGKQYSRMVLFLHITLKKKTTKKLKKTLGDALLRNQSHHSCYVGPRFAAFYFSLAFLWSLKFHDVWDSSLRP